ncbi:MAG: tail fiber domain-containing protein [Verrucomicrobia bacterium]|nr:MAG: tail fiber domain-containing protein [Verrucomicrobiota bacterium]
MPAYLTLLVVMAGIGVTTADNVVCIGAAGENVSNRCYIGYIRGRTVGNGDGINVIIDSSGQLGTSNSSRRFKKDIRPMDQISEAVLALRPVTFHYRNQDTKRAEDAPQFGLIAEDVAEVNPDLVVRDAGGELLAVRYDAVNAMLLNEFLKEHRKVHDQERRIQEQEATIAQLKKEMDALVARLKEQDSKIQKVIDQVEIGKAAPQLVASDQ